MCPIISITSNKIFIFTMNIIIPMAGRGTRLRPHTITVPKPLVPVAGKPIVQRLVEDIVQTLQTKVDNIGFVIGDFGAETEQHLLQVAEAAGAKGHIFYQDQPLGTAHAILCAAELLHGKTVVAFVDTLFKANFHIDTNADGIIWTHRVADPSKYGVVKLNEKNIITEFVEKPSTFVSDMAIIGIYYFKDGDYLLNELQYLLDNDIKDKGEYQLTSALENMKQKDSQFTIAFVEEWLDCGNKEMTVYTNQRILEFCADRQESLVAKGVILENSLIVPPCFIDSGVVLRNSVVGPHVSIGKNTHITNSVVRNSIIQNNNHISNKVLQDSMIGSHTNIRGKASDYSLGDYSTVEA